MNIGSCRWKTLSRPWTAGASTTTRLGPMVHWVISHHVSSPKNTKTRRSRALLENRAPMGEPKRTQTGRQLLRPRETCEGSRGPLNYHSNWIRNPGKLKPKPNSHTDWYRKWGQATYGYVTSSTYNSKPMVAEVLIDSGQANQIRKRQTNQDMISGESIPGQS